MKIQVLMENTTFSNDFVAEHGLSIYVETSRHKILFDSGQTDAFAKNAVKLGVDLQDVDIAILSHGHYDHGGGLKHFLEINSKARIYVNSHAFMPYFNGEKKYIGLDCDLLNNDRIVYVDDEIKIDDTLSLFSCNDMEKIVPIECYGLGMMEDEKIVPDDFRHEQYLMISENHKKVLFSGCSHKGILNIVSWFKPDVLVGGFHFMKLDCKNVLHRKQLQAAGDMLMKFPTKYYTAHCTGVEQYEFLKKIMGQQLEYLATGQKVIV